MAKHTVSQEVMDELEKMTWRDWFNANGLIEKLTKANTPVYDWLLTGTNSDEINARLVDAINYVLTEQEDLFEVEPVMYTVTEDTGGFEYSWFRANTGRLRSTMVDLSKYNLTLEEASLLYDLSEAGNKKLKDSNGNVIRESISDVQF